MRRGHWLLLAVAVSDLWASAACATIVCDFVLQPGGLYNDPVDGSRVPASGGRREISVVLRNTSANQNALAGFQFDIQADKVGAVALGPIGGTGTSGIGSRFHSPDWDSNFITDLSIHFATGAIPAAPGAVGLFNTQIANGNPNAELHLVGWIVVELAAKPMGSTISIQPLTFQAFTPLGNNLETAIGQAATFVYVPEPGMCLLAGLGSVALMARRRVGGVQ